MLFAEPGGTAPVDNWRPQSVILTRFELLYFKDLRRYPLNLKTLGEELRKKQIDLQLSMLVVRFQPCPFRLLLVSTKVFSSRALA